MLNIGPMELILILLVALVFVGPKKLPELGRTIGKSLRELRKAQDEVRSTLNFMDEPPRATPRRTPTRPSSPRETVRADTGTVEPDAEAAEEGSTNGGAAEGETATPPPAIASDEAPAGPGPRTDPSTEPPAASEGT